MPPAITAATFNELLAIQQTKGVPPIRRMVRETRC